jgi:hypothetical protein
MSTLTFLFRRRFGYTDHFVQDSAAVAVFGVDYVRGFRVHQQLLLQP